jgi:hypothetical protein
MQNLYKIKTKEKGITLFKYNRVQKNILNAIQGQSPIKHFSVKARQQGLSTFWILYWLDETIFNKGVNTGILAHKRESLGYLMDIVHLALAYMPEQIRPKLGDNNKSAVSFPEINSKIFCSLSIRSTGLHNLHISEWAFIKDKEIQATLGACNPRTTNITGETTGNGIGNDAYELYQAAKQGASEFRCNFFPWFIQEEYISPPTETITPTEEEKRLLLHANRNYGEPLGDDRLQWRRNQIKALKGLFKQEYPETDQDAFLMSGSNIFNPDKVIRLYQEAKEFLKDNPPYMQDDDQTYFEKPNKQDIYVAGADPAEGFGDYSVLKIINVSRKREAYIFRARCGIDHFYRICNEKGREFNNALLAVERNNHGYAVLLGLNENCEYPNIYKQTETNRLVGDIQKVTKYGWLTTKESKALMIDSLKMAVEGDSLDDEDHFMPSIIWLDVHFLNELLTFVQESGKMEAISGKHDDDIMATAIAFQMYFKNKKLEIKEIDNQTPFIISGSQRESRI